MSNETVYKFKKDIVDKFDVTVKIYMEKPTEDNPRGYISAYTVYPKREGEDWNRGNDLPDGDYTEETLLRIFNSVKNVYDGEVK